MFTTDWQPPAPTTCADLIDQVRYGDEQAWQDFVLTYGPSLYRWARKLGVQSSDASDVVQEVFLSVRGSVERFEIADNRRSFRPWLRTITINKVRDFLRWRARNPVAELNSGAIPREVMQSAPATDPACRATWWESLDAVQASCAPQTWQAFWGMTVEGRSASEVADETGLTKKAVRQAKYRVLQQLRDRLGQ